MEDFDHFDEIDAFLHEIDQYEYIIYTSLKDDFSIIYQSAYYYDVGAISDAYYQLRLGNSYLQLYGKYICFKSSRTIGWIRYNTHVALTDLIDIIYCPFNLELPDEEWDNGKLNFDNVIPDKNLIIKVDIDKIKKTMNKYEVLRLFL